MGDSAGVGADVTRSVLRDGAVAVVTGAGSGIGRAIARSLGARGARVLVTDIDESRADDTAAELMETGIDAVAQRCDVTQQSDLVEARERALRDWGRVDTVVNNVGVLALGAPEAIPVAEWQRVMDVNFMSVVRSNDVFLPGLIAQRSGHIVNTASVAGLLNFSHDRAPYASSKAAVIALSECLRIHLARFGVGVTCLCPAGVMTNIIEQMHFFGEQAPVMTPDLEMVDADTAGELTVDAVESGRFLVFTDDEARTFLLDKARDTDAYLDRRIAAVHGST